MTQHKNYSLALTFTSSHISLLRAVSHTGCISNKLVPKLSQCFTQSFCMLSWFALWNEERWGWAGTQGSAPCAPIPSLSRAGTLCSHGQAPGVCAGLCSPLKEAVPAWNKPTACPEQREFCSSEATFFCCCFFCFLSFHCIFIRSHVLT